MAMKHFGLPFQAFQLTLAGMVLRRDRRLKVMETWFGPGRLRVMSSGTGLIFKPLQAPIEELKAALDTSGLLPGPFAIKSCKGGDGLGETAQIGDECCNELGEGTPARPRFREQSVERFLGIVVGQSGGAARVRQQAS
jgi:hypothetical protein